MFSSVLSIHPGMAATSRLPVLTREAERIRAVEVVALVGAGACAALASAFLDFGLRIPGHAILRAIFPMALGLALAPRRGGGTVMGASALATALGIQAVGHVTIGMGAMTSLVLTGPLLDLVVRGGYQGWRLHASFALAGLTSNLVAYLVRAGAKSGGWERWGTRPLSSWWSQAMVTYALCGIIAGVLSSVILFHLSRRTPRSEQPSES